MDEYAAGKLSKWTTKLVNLTREIFTPSVIVNGYIYQHYGQVLHRNWGDDLNYYLIREMTGRHVVVYDYSSLAHRLHKTNYMAVGSSLTLLCNDRTVVWGAGVIDPAQELPTRPMKVLAVRGPLTREYLLSRNIVCPEVYGDPALLLPRYYRPQVTKKYRLGVIPHYLDYDNPALESIKHDPDVLIIRTEHYRHWHDLIDQICSCACIASSSLHGLIVAEAYGVPNLWIEVSDRIMGGHFKYHDFFRSIGRDREQPFVAPPQGIVREELISRAQDWKPGSIDLDKLLSACPFPLENKHRRHG